MSTFSMSSRKRKHNRLGKCDICRSIDAKYTCPRCDAVTCSLECVKKHKSDLDCDGVRVKTKFVPVNQMNECTFLSDYRLLEEVARCVEEAEWKRESLETPQQAVLDIQGDDAEVIGSDPVKVAVDTEEGKEPTVAVPEQCVSEAVPSPICEDITKKSKKQKKRKSKNPVPSDSLSKTDMLIAKAERIRQQIFKSRKINPSATVHQEGKVDLTKQPEEDSDEDKSKKCELGNQDVKSDERAEDNDDVEDNENLSSSSQESTDSNNSSSSSPDESDDIEEVVEDEDDELPDELPLLSTTEEIAPPNELKNENEGMEIGQEVVTMNDSNFGVEERKLSKEELLHIKKEKLRASVALGGTKKAMTMECLANAAFSRGIHLTTLPEKFEKHWENSSFFVSNEDCIYWRLKVSFINANFYTLSLNECPETITLESVITGCLQQSKQFYEEHGKDDPLIVYRTIDFSKISVLMAADKLPYNQRKFYILDPTKSLRENFRGKCIVEFPHLCIAIQDCYVVSQVHEKVMLDFFNGETFEGDEKFKDNPEPKNEFERKWNKLANRERRKKEEKGHRKHVNHENDSDSDRESGELTDSSGSSCSDSEEEELFEESEFRSIYKDLLTTFDIDVNQLQKK